METKDRYIKLKSVGCMFDLKTGYTFPIITLTGKEKEADLNQGDVVHINDCSYEWIEALKGIDKALVRIWFKNNQKFGKENKNETND